MLSTKTRIDVQQFGTNQMTYLKTQILNNSKTRNYNLLENIKIKKIRRSIQKIWKTKINLHQCRSAYQR